MNDGDLLRRPRIGRDTVPPSEGFFDESGADPARRSENGYSHQGIIMHGRGKSNLGRISTFLLRGPGHMNMRVKMAGIIKVILRVCFHY